MHHIRSTLPDIKAKINQNLAKFEAELASLGGAQGAENSVSLLATTMLHFQLTSSINRAT